MKRSLVLLLVLLLVVPMVALSMFSCSYNRNNG